MPASEARDDVSSADDTGTVIFDEEGEYPTMDPELEDALNKLKISGTPYKTPNQRKKANGK